MDNDLQDQWPDPGKSVLRRVANVLNYYAGRAELLSVSEQGHLCYTLPYSATRQIIDRLEKSGIKCVIKRLKKDPSLCHFYICHDKDIITMVRYGLRFSQMRSFMDIEQLANPDYTRSYNKACMQRAVYLCRKSEVKYTGGKIVISSSHLTEIRDNIINAGYHENDMSMRFMTDADNIPSAELVIQNLHLAHALENNSRHIAQIKTESGNKTSLVQKIPAYTARGHHSSNFQLRHVAQAIGFIKQNAKKFESRQGSLFIEMDKSCRRKAQQILENANFTGHINDYGDNISIKMPAREDIYTLIKNGIRFVGMTGFVPKNEYYKYAGSERTAKLERVIKFLNQLSVEYITSTSSEGKNLGETLKIYSPYPLQRIIKELTIGRGIGFDPEYFCFFQENGSFEAITTHDYLIQTLISSGLKHVHIHNNALQPKPENALSRYRMAKTVTSSPSACTRS